MYYVYEWYVIETNEVFYVGKGTRNRYKVKKHNKFFNDFISRQNCDSRIIKTFQKEEDAFSYEYERIKELKALGQCVCNIYEGGTGGTTSWWTKEIRERYSKKNVMKSEKQRIRMSQNNPMKNKEVSQKVGMKNRRRVIIGDRVYNSVSEAKNAYNTCFETIRNWCKKGINPIGEICRYEDEEQVIFEGKRYNKGGCRELMYKGKIYESPIDLSKEIGVSNSTICNWTKRGFDPQGNICRYSDDKRNLTFVPNRNSELHSKPIIVNGVRYNSRKEAEEKLGLKPGYLAPYIKGIRKNNKYICKYDNQHPRQGKSDNSTLQGSTTNE